MSRDNLETRVQRTLYNALSDPASMEPGERAAVLKLSIEFIKLKHKIDDDRTEGSALDEALKELESGAG